MIGSTITLPLGYIRRGRGGPVNIISFIFQSIGVINNPYNQAYEYREIHFKLDVGVGTGPLGFLTSRIPEGGPWLGL